MCISIYLSNGLRVQLFLTSLCLLQAATSPSPLAPNAARSAQPPSPRSGSTGGAPIHTDR